ncbi:hypothetical protein CCR94_21885 [Rhodoblastus sphagnicola]|uniref:Uncharacterized protein n=1 Tax=Rhodoblastus sphagnicola TaxID=333368 RepID=A0A2S6MWD8_9HYPH|nr:hypothetical protein CCR94_21885 [Rhodoblastus sphagnicola]
MWRFAADRAAIDGTAQTAQLARQSGAIDAISPDHQGNQGIVEQGVDASLQHLRVHVGSFRLEVRNALDQRRQSG